MSTNANNLSDGNLTACLLWKCFFLFFLNWSSFRLTCDLNFANNVWSRNLISSLTPPKFSYVCYCACCVCLAAERCVFARFTFNGFCRSEWELPKWQRELHRNRSYFLFLCLFLINQSNISELYIIRAFQYGLNWFVWDVCRRWETCYQFT